MPPIASIFAVAVAGSHGWLDLPAALARSDDDPDPMRKVIAGGVALGVWLVMAMGAAYRQSKKRQRLADAARGGGSAQSVAKRMKPTAGRGAPVRATGKVTPRLQARALPPAMRSQPARQAAVRQAPPPVKRAKSVKKPASSAASALPPLPAGRGVVSGRPPAAPTGAEIRRHLASAAGRRRVALLDLFDPPPGLRE